MKYYAVIDTNVLVSALLSKHEDSGTVKVLRAILSGVIKPVYSKEIIEEYYEVLHRKEGKYNFTTRNISAIIEAIVKTGIKLSGIQTDETPSDPKDIIFYEVTMDARQERDAHLVTGNIKDFPVKPFIVTPAEMMRIIEGKREK